VIIEPGNIRTEWGGIAAEKLEQTSANGPYRELAELVGRGLRSSESGRMGSEPSVVADAIAKAVQSPKPKTRYPVGGGARIILFAERVLPDRGFDRFITTLYRFAPR
jgi:hypothetical protein